MHRTAIQNLANRLHESAISEADTACKLMTRKSVEAWVLEESTLLRFTFPNATDLHDILQGAKQLP